MRRGGRGVESGRGRGRGVGRGAVPCRGEVPKKWRRSQSSRVRRSSGLKRGQMLDEAIPTEGQATKGRMLDPSCLSSIPAGTGSELSKHTLLI